MTQTIGKLAPDVPPVDKRVHLMHTNPGQAGLVSFENVEDRWGLPVGQGHDDVRTRLHKPKHVLGSTFAGRLIPGHLATVTTSPPRPYDR